MEPIGTTFKRDGEIMIVHKCLGCGKISQNRIAGDDNTDSILALLDGQQGDKDRVLTALFGNDITEQTV